MRIIAILILGWLFAPGNAQHFDWTLQPSGTNQWLNDIQFTDLQHGCAVGTNGAIVVTHDGGEHWGIRESGTTGELRSVFFLNRDTGWVAGGSTGAVLLHTTDGGETWTSTTGALPDVASLQDVEFSDALHGYAIGGAEIYETKDGGVTWETGSYSSLVASILDLGELQVVPGTGVFVCGYYRNKSNQTLPGIFENISLPDDKWMPQGLAGLDPGDTLTAIRFSDPRTGFSGSKTGKVYTMREEGGIFPGSWSLNFESGKGEVRSIAFPSGRHGMFNADGKVSGQTVQWIYHTSDTGSTWSGDPDMVPDLVRGRLTAPGVNHAWLAGSNGRIYKGVRREPVSAIAPAEGTLEILPNPFHSTLVLESSVSLLAARFELIDMTGRTVRAVRMDEPVRSYTLTGLEGLHNGVYVARVTLPRQGLILTRKVVKR